jgi:uncharacterized RDD family membrane protein YckC
VSDGGGGSPAPRVPTVDDFPESGPNALATFSQRAWARVLDTLIVFYVFYRLAQYAPIRYEETDLVVANLGWLLLGWVLLAGAYEVILVAISGRTAGKMVIGTRVARYADGANPTWSQATLRSLPPLAAATVLGRFGLPVVGAGAVYLSSLSNPLVRGWHDLAAGTVVIRTR